MSEQPVLVAQSVEAAAPPKFRRVHIIINPASGQDRPVLSILNDVFHPSSIEWEMSVTKDAGDGRRYALAALEAGADAIGVYGGDGTVNEVASALVGTDTPLAIFPGGTANVMSVELGIPSDLLEACALVSRGTGVVRAIDVGDTGDNIFLTRIGMGFEATVIEQTEREQKDRHGWLAYALNGLRQLVDPKLSHYRLTIDGEAIETDGLACMVANSGILSPNSGLPGKSVISFSPAISITDGLLDILVVRSGDLGYLLSVAANMVAGAEGAQPLLHWTGREVSVVADPPQSIQYDGEVIGYTPVTARVRPQALRVIVPAGAAPPVGSPGLEPLSAPLASQS
ncbi:MAG: diacylglycerol kinase family protein [Anaerolineales bacterium]